jgi:myo-inositol 2-dehydrogenase/D-chiro-inositol 1-dehydrogenase
MIGVGKWGSLVAAEVGRIPGLRLAGVTDHSTERAHAAAERLGARAYETVEECLADPAVQAVLITVPNDLHAEAALAALWAGKHVYLEKPMALTVQDAEAVIAAAAERQVVLTVGHTMRYFEPIMEVKRLVAAGTLGRLLAATVSRRDYLQRSAWLGQRRRVGGLLYQSACHEYDFLRWLCGEVTEIYCLAAPHVIAHETLDYPDLIVSQLRFESGVVGQVWNCMTDPLMGYDGVITGSEGTIWFDVYEGRVRWQRIGEAAQERLWTPPHRWGPWAWIEGRGAGDGETEAVRIMLGRFREAVAGRAAPDVTGQDGARVVEIAQAGYLSLVERRPVALPLPAADRGRATYLEIPIHPPQEAR